MTGGLRHPRDGSIDIESRTPLMAGVLGFAIVIPSASPVPRDQTDAIPPDLSPTR